MYRPTKFLVGIASFFCFCRHRPSWPLLKMDILLGSVDENNTGDGRTLSCVPQESPSVYSTPVLLRTILGQYTSPPPSIMAADPRRIVGSMVEAKACHVTNLAECARRYGSNSKTKKVQGIVTHVEVIKNSTTNRTTTFVTAAYDLGGTTIRPCRLNI